MSRLHTPAIAAACSAAMCVRIHTVVAGRAKPAGSAHAPHVATAIALAALLSFAGRPCAAQGAASPAAAPGAGHADAVGTPAPIGMADGALDADALRDLPNADSLYSLLETTQPSLTSDRFSGGGLSTGQASRVGSFFSSWSQTVFRLGDVDLSDPSGSGLPLLLPDPALWQRVAIATAMMPLDLSAAGAAVTLEPMRPSGRWVRTVSGTTSNFGAAATRSGPPAVTRLDGWDDVHVVASGPLGAVDAQGRSRLGAVVAGSWTRGTAFSKSDPTATQGTVGSAFLQLLYTPDDATEAQAIGWLQRATHPFDARAPFGQPGAATTDQSAHLQAAWTRTVAGLGRTRLYGGYTQRAETPDDLGFPAGVVYERLLDGPLSAIASIATKTTVRQWTAGAKLLPATATASRTGSLEAGVAVSGATARATGFFGGSAGELLNGVPARLWRFTAPGPASVRHERTVAAYAADRIALAPRLATDLGLRFDGTSGSADGAARGISWRSWLPRVDLQWLVSRQWPTTVFVGVGRSASRLPLDLLAAGDPAAPTADVSLWRGGDPAAAPIIPLVARVGPGTGTGTGAALTSIDPALARPLTDEFALGMQTSPIDPLTLRVMGFARRERHAVALVDVGAPASSYSTLTVADPGIDLIGTQDDQLLPIYNRSPASFGLDRYVLTNATEAEATSESFEISGTLRTARVDLFGGASASMSHGSAASRGYGPLENDQSVLGEILIDPNADTYARGRLFVDRAYTIKISSSIRLPADIRLGVVARYQDGQPFARLVVVPGLAQGAEAVRAFANGASRFTFTQTLDLRVQKGVAVGRGRLDAVLDVFNLIDLANEVEEDVVTGASYRTVTAVQPPRAVHLGLRVTF